MNLGDFSDVELQSQAVAAGFSTVELYIQNLLERDADRLAVKRGLDDLEAGKHRSFEEFNQEFRSRNGLDARN